MVDSFHQLPIGDGRASFGWVCRIHTRGYPSYPIMRKAWLDGHPHAIWNRPATHRPSGFASMTMLIDVHPS